MSASTHGGGSQVGGFAIVEEIGRGSFATVFKGQRPHSATTTTTGPSVSENPPLVEYVAIKSVAREKLNRKLAENLESEIRILKDIRHVNIVGLIDIVKSEKHIHLIMEFCSLGDLSQYIRRRGQIGNSPLGTTANVLSDPNINPLAGPWGGLNEFIVRNYLNQLASAMEVLRNLSLIHRDLKPQNVLLHPPPDNSPTILLPSTFKGGKSTSIPALPIIKLADFGFARALPQQSLASTLCGSPLYMAPEILRGDRYDAKADLWSVGAILYEMLIGRPPFKAQNHIDLLRKIDRGNGLIAFPGEEAPTRDVRHDSTGPPRVAGSLPARTSGVFLPHGSSGTSPRFSAASHSGAIPITDDMKDLIRRLLKRNPVERMTFEEFFLHPAVLTYSSPLSSVHSNLPLHSPLEFQRINQNTTSSVNITPSINTIQQTTTSTHGKEAFNTNFIKPTPLSRRSSGAESPRPNEIYTPRRQSNTSTTLSSSNNVNIIQPTHHLQIETMKSQNATLSPSPSFHQQKSKASIEIPFPEYNLDPAKIFGNIVQASQSEILKNPLETGPSTSASNLKPESSQSNPKSSQKQSISHTASPPPTDDYIVIEKRAVEVNWLADQLVSNSSRRNPLQHPPSHSNPQKSVSVHPVPVPITHRTPSSTPPYPRSTSFSSSSRDRESVLPRIFGSLRESAHQFLESSFQSEHTPRHDDSTTTTSTITGISQTTTEILTRLNLCSMRAYAIHTLAESFYKDFVVSGHDRSQSKGVDDVIDGTPSSLGIAEEAVTLYVFALGLYQTGMESAKLLWSIETSSSSTSSGAANTTGGNASGALAYVGAAAAGLFGVGGKSPQQTSPIKSGVSSHVAVDLKSLSDSVQWIRDRFNDCLERAQEIKHVLELSASGSEESVTGRSVERIVYERSLELAKNAAIEESSGNYLPAESGYTQAILLLEAALSNPSTFIHDSTGLSSTMTENDRLVMERFVTSLGRRLARLKRNSGSAQSPGKPVSL